MTVPVGRFALGRQVFRPRRVGDGLFEVALFLSQIGQ